MTNNTYRILQLAVISIVLSTFLAACDMKQRSEQQTIRTTTKETVQIATTETIQTENGKETQESLTGWQVAYKTVIANTLNACKEKYPDEVNHGRYGLYDFDNDSISELFLEVYGSTMSDYYIYVYDFDGEQAVFVDSIESAHSWVYGTNRENAFLSEYCWMGVSVWNVCELKNGEFVSEKLVSYYPDGFGESVKPEENPLPDMGYEIKEIKYYRLEDYTPLSVEPVVDGEGFI